MASGGFPADPLGASGGNACIHHRSDPAISSLGSGCTGFLAARGVPARAARWCSTAFEGAKRSAECLVHGGLGRLDARQDLAHHDLNLI